MSYLFSNKAFNTMIINPDTETLRSLAKKDEITTQYNSAGYITQIRNRSSNDTYVVRTVDIGIDQKGIDITEAQDIIKEVDAYLETQEIIRLDRRMGIYEKFSFNCRLYITKDYARIASMWNNTLFEPTNLNNPDLVSVYVPEWPAKMIIVQPNKGITYILGTDYFGEAKKSFLRMAMYKVKLLGGIGLHAGSKVLRVKDINQKLKDVGIIMFGLSGTGKTTLTIHGHGLTGEESSSIRQDDVIFMDQDGYCAGTENGFFIKTEGLDESQQVLFKAATTQNAIFENVTINESGAIDFDDTTLTSNGRGIVLRSDIDTTHESIDLVKAHKIVFITRRDDILPPVAKLSHKEAVTHFILGESIETSAGDPTRAGRSKRCVGTNPFIIGKETFEAERFMAILKNNPDMECFLLNTGRVGKSKNFEGKKLTIDVSTTLLKEIAKDTIQWTSTEEGEYSVPAYVPGLKIEEYLPETYYSKEEYQALVRKLKAERTEWLRKYPMLHQTVLHD